MRWTGRESGIGDAMSYGDLLSEEELLALDELVRGPHQASVLLVDGDDALYPQLAAALQGLGLRCLRAPGRAEALELLASRSSIGLLVCALHLPDGSGLELVRQVRQSARARLPVVMMAGDATVQDAVEALHLKVLDFLLGPPDLAHLTTLARNELGTPPEPKVVRRRPRPKEAAVETCLALKSA